MPIMSSHRVKLARVSAVVVGLAAFAVTMSACASESNLAINSPASIADKPSPSATAADVTGAQPDISWECGYVSAVRTVSFHADGLLAKGLIDQASYDARQEAARQIWSSFPQGTSTITPVIREVSSLAKKGILPQDPAMQSAIDQIVSGCESNGTPVILGALASQGG